MKIICKIIASFLIVITASYADFGIDFDGATLFGANTDSPLADGSLIVVVTTSAESFSGPIDGSFISGDDVILGSGYVSSEDSGFSGGFIFPLYQIDLTSTIQPGQQVAIFWFDGITSIDTLPQAGDRYGFYTDPTWLIPADGAKVTFSLATENIPKGTVPVSMTVANLVVGVIPEPASLALVFSVAAVGGFFFRRRSRAVL